MRTKFHLLLIGAVVALFFSCQKDTAIKTDRPHDPWVFRSVLDSLPRIATVALHDDLFVAYRTETGALYKAWKGAVNFDGAVYTTAHGPQPSSLGNSWLVNKFETPWRLVKGGQETTPEFQYRGHYFEKGQVWFNYELKTGDGSLVKVSERPEYVTNPSGQTGFERTFKTEGAPEGTQVVLVTNLSSISFENAIETDGDWKIENKTDREFKKLQGIDVDGRLSLNSNGTTRFTAYFTKMPLIENDNKIAGAEDTENLPLGMRIIARNDCKTCHNTYVATVGPSYVEVAGKYRNTPDNIAMLMSKVKNGGAGVWGQAAMTPHADLPDNDIRLMVEYIMGLDSLEEAKLASIPKSEKKLALEEAETGINEAEMFPGAVVKVYQYDRNLTKIADMQPYPAPVFEGVVSRLHATAEDFGGLTDNFGLVAEGYFHIPKDNNYVFRLISDDGSRLHIDGKLVIDHDGLHGDEPKDGEVALKAGYHPFRLDYFEAGGGNMISLQWKSFDDGGGLFEIVPASLLAHNKNDTPGGTANAVFGTAQPSPATSGRSQAYIRATTCPKPVPMIFSLKSVAWISSPTAAWS